jgi:hypothetical protein
MIRLTATSAQRADLIDALHLALELTEMKIRSELPPMKRDWDPSDKDNFAEWDGQRKRFTALRRVLLKEEKASLASFAKERKILLRFVARNLKRKRK